MAQETVFNSKPQRLSKFAFSMRRPSSFIIAFILQYIIVTVISYVLLIFDIPFFMYMPFGLSSLMSSLFYLSVLWILFFFISRRPKLLRKILPLGHLFVSELDTINAEVEAIRTESSYSETEGFLVRRLKAINVIDERIEALRARSTFMLSSIGILLIASAIIIVFSGSLTNLDVSAASDVDKISSAVTDTETKIGRLSDLLELRRNLSDPAKRDAAAKRLDNLGSSYANLPTEENAIQTLITSQQKRLEDQRELLRTAWDKQLRAEHGYADTRYIIATAITRIGVVLIIVFLVQILIGLYRYNARLITFYNSRRDFLQLW